MLASAVVAVAKVVVELVTEAAKKYAAEEGSSLIHRLVESLLSRHKGDQPAPKPVLDPDELVRAREVAHRARRRSRDRRDQGHGAGRRDRGCAGNRLMTFADADVRRQLGRLPKETTPRVILAVLAFVIASIAVGESVWFGVYGEHQAELLKRCRAESTDVATTVHCVRASEHERVLWTVAWGPVALAVAGVSAAVASGWRRRSLTTEGLERLPALQALADDASRAVGVERAPLLWHPARPIALGRADGMVRPYVEVGIALMTRSLTAPREAAAILRHENVHHKLRDVPVSRMLWWTGPVGLLIVVPFLIRLGDEDASAPLWGLARLAAVALLIGLTRAAVLRAREFDADLVAAIDDPQSLIDALPRDPRRRGPWAVVTAPFAHHPPPATRRATVEKPWSAYRLDALDAVMVGVTAAFGASVLSRLARFWFEYGRPAVYAELIGWSAIGLVLGAWLAMMLVRAVGAASVTGEPAHFTPFVWGLAVAVLAGILLFDQQLSLDPRPARTTVVGIGTVVILVIGVVVAAFWLRDLIAEWLEPLTDRLGGDVARRTLIVLGALLTALLLGVLAALANSGAIYDRLGEAARLQGTDPNEFFSLGQLAGLLAGEWFSVVLMAVALTIPVGLSVFGRAASRPAASSRPPLWSADARRTCVVVVVGAGIAIAAFVTYERGWEPDATASAHGWLASAQIAYAGVTMLGVVAGLSASTVVLATTRSGLPVVGAAAVVSGAAAGTGAWVELGRHDGLWLIVHDVGVIALVTALVAAAVFGALGLRGRLSAAWPVVLVVPLLAAIPLVALGVDASRATPSLEEDKVHYRPLLQTFIDEHTLTILDSACNGPVHPELLGQVEDTGAALDRPGFRPATSPLRRWHDSLREVFALCVRGIRQATKAHADALPQPVLDDIGRAEQRYINQGAKLYPKSE